MMTASYQQHTMEYVLLGAGVGCWMYAFVNTRYNENPWIGSTPFVWIGLAMFMVGIVLFLQ